ncbi:hypothetical protein GGS23DRAFT_178889 [Durotheca rogersii]|uniref:uncharacterized protein n=1 Tax=Durotheca rogersii TaxID=419775 RepID=UPI0022203E5B|nr:uncharacterized protein GGS23DRAFT_178889 [Durotheca rogersii]KAI5867462.1 hypothetical protein GGS23DRAFT_178889 [Durotheca rogersii]
MGVAGTPSPGGGAPRASSPPASSRCPPLPLEIWTQIMRAVVHCEDLPELWPCLRLASHVLKAAVETAFADEHLARVFGCLYVGDPRGPGDLPRPTALPGVRRIVPLPLALARLSPDRRRARFVSAMHRDDPALAFSPAFADCTDDTAVAEWLRYARGPPPSGSASFSFPPPASTRHCEAHLRLNIGPDCAWSHWKHHVIGPDGFVVESRRVAFEDEAGGAGCADGQQKGGAEGGQEAEKRTPPPVPARAIGLVVDRTRCEVELDWVTLVSCVFARPPRQDL